MTQLYTLLFCILFTQPVKSQVFDSLIQDIKENCRSVKQLEKAFDRYQQNDKHLSIGSAWRVFPTFFDKREKYEIINSGYSFPWLYLAVISKNDRIIYLDLLKNDYDKIKQKSITDTIFSFLDTIYSQRILKKNNTDKNIQFTYKDLYAYEYEYFGPDGGMLFLGPSNQLTGIFEAIIQKDSLSILKKAKSIYAEEAALGAMGLYIWNKTVNPLDTKASSLLSTLRSSPRKIISGHGCLIEASKLSIELGDYYMNEVFQGFLDWKKE